MTPADDIDLTDPDRFVDGPPHRMYRWLRDEAPVYWHEPTPTTPDGEGFWCLTRHDDVTWAAKNPDLFSSVGGGDRQGGGTLIEDLPAGFAAGVLFNMQDDPRHQHIRRLVTPSVSPKRLRTIQAALADRGVQILDAALATETCDFLVDVAAELPLQAIASLLGVPQEDRHFLLDWADATLDFDDHDPGQTSARAQEAAVAMAAYSNRLLAEKRGSAARAAATSASISARDWSTDSPAIKQRSMLSRHSPGYAGSCVPPAMVAAWMEPRPYEACGRASSSRSRVAMPSSMGPSRAMASMPFSGSVPAASTPWLSSSNQVKPPCSTVTSRFVRSGRIAASGW